MTKENRNEHQDLPKDLDTKLQVLNAVSDERKRTASVADLFGGGFAGQVGKEIANKIREGPDA